MTAPTAAERAVVKKGLAQIPTDGLQRGLAYAAMYPILLSGRVASKGVP